jgi:beta-glucosidase
MADSSHKHDTLIFPKGFLWGSATSAHQVEGDNNFSDWWQWEVEGRVPYKSGKAAEHYTLYEYDFDLAKKYNQNAHRLSIEWARIEPEQGVWDHESIEHYRKVFKALKKRHIKIMLTLTHFTLPQWVAAEGGWTRKKTVDYFIRFVTKVAQEYENDIDLWITVNEPSVYTSMSYVVGDWPPKRKNYFLAFLVSLNLIRAHKRAYKTIHDQCGKDAQVGYANNMISLMSYSFSFFDYIYMRITDFLWNHLFYKLTRGTHDFLGVNYYFHQRIIESQGYWFGKLVDVREEKREFSDMGWEVYPHGIFEALVRLRKYNLPVYITENGIAALNDDKRIRFIVGHVKELYHAIQSGVDIKGYFYWSLLDNFEWDKGFAPRFGMIGVNYENGERHPHVSADVFSRVAKDNGVTHETLIYLGHQVTKKCEHD